MWHINNTGTCVNYQTEDESRTNTTKCFAKESAQQLQTKDFFFGGGVGGGGGEGCRKYPTKLPNGSEDKLNSLTILFLNQIFESSLFHQMKTVYPVALAHVIAETYLLRVAETVS